MISNQPLDSIIRSDFFVRRHSENEIPPEWEALCLQPQEIRNQDGYIVFHVLGSASVKVPALFAEFERIEGPVGAARFDHIQMADEENRTLYTCAAKFDYEVGLTRRRGEDLDIRIRNPASRKRASSTFTAGVVLPTVLMLISSLKISRAS